MQSYGVQALQSAPPLLPTLILLHLPPVWDSARSGCLRGVKLYQELNVLFPVADVYPEV